MFIYIIFLLSTVARAEVRPTLPAECGPMTTWDFTMGMCMPRAMAGMPMRMLMVNGNAFATQVVTEGPRGQSAFAAPNMLMIDVGRTIGAVQYFNLDAMLTSERWTIPKDGYPQLTQIGEHNANGTPYLDAQHPHSSPLMGLTLSDTISLGAHQDHVKVWVAPRGQSTDGPVAFMHRPTGMMIPDAPLGHHVGQDVGHISSSVVGAHVRRNQTTVQASTFHGREPEPTRIDLPVGRPDSYAARVIQEFNSSSFAAASVAFVNQPEAHDQNLNHIWRYSTSYSFEHAFAPDWVWRQSMIVGLTNFYDHVPSLASVGSEFWLKHHAHNIWGRGEALERSPAQLRVERASSPRRGRAVAALTLGYTYDMWVRDGLAWSVGSGLTQTLVHRDLARAYGASSLTSARVFLQVSGMKMWSL